MSAVNGRTGKRRDGAPALIGGDFELVLCPLPQSGNGGWPSNEAKIKLVFVHWSLTGVTFSKKLQDDALVKI